MDSDFDILLRAASELVAELRKRISGLPDHPWIPGVEFADGKLPAAIDRVAAAAGCWKVFKRD